MKKNLYLITTIMLSGAALFLSSCLKDKSYVDFSKVGTIVNFPLGGTPFFSSDAITSTADTITEQFAVNISSPTAPTTATTITLAVDNSVVTSYNAANTAVNYLDVPTNAFVFTTTTATIAAGQRTAVFTVTFYKGLLDPSKSYMLPIRITNAGGLNISGNQNIMYYHFIGNDFAGTYEHYYSRWQKPDTTTTPLLYNADEGPAIFSPVSPTEFTVQTEYYTQPNYDVTFTKTGNGATATYSNFQVQFLPGDVAAGTQWASAITVGTQPEFVPNKIAFNANGSYTFAQALELFRFYFTTSSRALIDNYVKQ